MDTETAQKLVKCATGGEGVGNRRWILMTVVLTYRLIPTLVINS